MLKLVTKACALCNDTFVLEKKTAFILCVWLSKVPAFNAKAALPFYTVLVYKVIHANIMGRTFISLSHGDIPSYFDTLVNWKPLQHEEMQKCVSVKWVLGLVYNPLPTNNRLPSSNSFYRKGICPLYNVWLVTCDGLVNVWWNTLVDLMQCILCTPGLCTHLQKALNKLSPKVYLSRWRYLTLNPNPKFTKNLIWKVS